MMKLTVTQPATIKVRDTDTILTSGRQYSFVINRLQTVYIESLDDLTGTKILLSLTSQYLSLVVISVEMCHIRCMNLLVLQHTEDYLTFQVSICNH